MQTAEEKFIPKHYSIISDILYYIRHYRKYEPMVLVFSGLEILLGALVPLLAIWLPKIAVDLVVQGTTIPRAVKVLGLLHS